jgi:RNA polymerase sigma-70 factor (ECF subfamily)
MDPEKALVAAGLVERCRAGDSGAWDEIVREHTRRVYNFCYRSTGRVEDAQDLTQEVFIKAYRGLDQFQPERAAFTTWLTSIARNAVVDHFRRTKKDRLTDSIDASAADDERPGSELQIVDTNPSPQDRLDARDAREKVEAALQHLSPEYREVLILRDLQDMDYAEIAALLKLPEGTVKSRISRGRAELARLLLRTYKQVPLR